MVGFRLWLWDLMGRGGGLGAGSLVCEEGIRFFGFLGGGLRIWDPC